MKRHSLVAVIALILLIVNSPASIAETVRFPCGDGAYYSVVVPSGVATDGSKCSGNLVIDTSVKVIGRNAFSFSKISSITLPDSVISIEANGLAYLKLESIDLGRSIESLGFEAFRGTRVKSIELPNTLKTIGDSALADTSFTEISIPNSVTSIERGAFAREDSQVPLNSIAIPDSVKSLGFGAFVRSGLKSVTIGKGLKEISASAFEGNNISEITIPSNVKTIQAFAFRGNPLQRVYFGNSVEVIDSEAFARTQLTTLSLPKSLTGIGTKAFANIPTLKEIDFPDGFNPMFTASNVPTVGDIFEGSYSISRILYCGKATGFYVPPTCEGSRKSIYDAANSAQSKLLDQESILKENAKLVFEKEQNESIQQAQQLASVSPKPISIKIIAENPICPKEFIQTLPARQSQTPYGKVIICESIVKSPEERAAAEKAVADKAAADKLAAELGLRILSAQKLYFDTNLEIDSLIKLYPSKNAELILYKSKIASFESITQLNLPTAEVNLKGIATKIETLKNLYAKLSKSVNCVKGKKSLKVKDVKPVCPAGYKKK